MTVDKLPIGTVSSDQDTPTFELVRIKLKAALHDELRDRCKTGAAKMHAGREHAYRLASMSITLLRANRAREEVCYEKR